VDEPAVDALGAVDQLGCLRHARLGGLRGAADALELGRRLLAAA
jgi:hypothetical protein